MRLCARDWCPGSHAPDTRCTGRHGRHRRTSRAGSRRATGGRLPPPREDGSADERGNDERLLRSVVDDNTAALTALGVDVDEFTTHSYRRTTATFVERAAGIALASRLLGHANEQITRASHAVSASKSTRSQSTSRSATPQTTPSATSRPSGSTAWSCKAADSRVRKPHDRRDHDRAGRTTPRPGEGRGRRPLRECPAMRTRLDSVDHRRARATGYRLVSASAGAPWHGAVAGLEARVSPRASPPLWPPPTACLEQHAVGPAPGHSADRIRWSSCDRTPSACARSQEAGSPPV